MPNKLAVGKEEEEVLSSSTYASSMANEDSIYHKQDMCTVIAEILKVAVPTTISSTASQLIYLINFVLAGRHENTEKLTGLGIGQAISQCCGILIFLGLNSAL